MHRYYPAPSLPSPFLWRRLQSLMGLFIVIFLIEHLLTNSQSALLIGDDGHGFIRAVNKIHELPFLPVIEILFIGAPFLIHGIWGAMYLRSAKMNSLKIDGSTPYLPYPRNHAYSWQRITSYILIIGIIAHVVHMRFIKYPSEARVNGQEYWMVQLDRDSGLDSLAARLNVRIVDNQETSPEIEQPISEGQVIAIAKDFGTAELLLVRETFKMPFMILLYTFLVLASCYHGFNGVWTFLITWGISLTAKSQKLMRHITTLLMILIAFLGLASAWGTYWINLKY